MQFGILKTDNGKHSDEKLAVATAGDIIQVAAESVSKEAIDARKLEIKIIEILEDHHKKVSESEMGALTSDPAHIATSLDPRPHLDDTCVEILKAADESPFAEWFKRPDVRENVVTSVARWTATNMSIHRDWHGDGKTGHGADLKDVAVAADCPHVRSWKDRRSGASDPGGGLPFALISELKGT